MKEVTGAKILQTVGTRYQKLTEGISAVQFGCDLKASEDVGKVVKDLYDCLAMLKALSIIEQTTIDRFEKHLNHPIMYFRPWTAEQLKNAVFPTAC